MLYPRLKKSHFENTKTKFRNQKTRKQKSKLCVLFLFFVSLNFVFGFSDFRFSEKTKNSINDIFGYILIFFRIQKTNYTEGHGHSCSRTMAQCLDAYAAMTIFALHCGDRTNYCNTASPPSSFELLYSVFVVFVHSYSLCSCVLLRGGG